MNDFCLKKKKKKIHEYFKHNLIKNKNNNSFFVDLNSTDTDSKEVKMK